MKSVFRSLLASILFLALTASGCNNAPDDVVSVTISGAASVHRGAFTLFSASGAGTSGVTWTIVETDKHTNTAIDVRGFYLSRRVKKKRRSP